MRRNELINIINDCIKREESRKELLCDILEDIKYNDEKLEVRDINDYLIKSERDFIYSKLLHLYKNEQPDFDDDPVSVQGKYDYFPASLTYENDMFVFVLPPMYSAKRKDNTISSGQYMRYLVLNLIKDSKLSLHVLKKPVIYFEHHACTNVKGELSHLADADNMDAKACQDALQGFFYNDDNILTLTTVHRGVKDRIAFTKMCVMEEEIFRNNIRELLLNAT